MIVFMTNYLNPHQLPFAMAMSEMLGEQFRFVSMSRITQARLNIGFEDLDRKYPFVIRAYESQEQLEKAIRLVNECETLVVGSVEDRYLLPRLKNNKLTLRYCERYFKTGLNLHNALSAFKHIVPFSKYKNLYYLCSSAYTAADINTFANFKDRTYKWGYFPEIREHADFNALLDKKQAHSILWCGRMVAWKHPEAAVQVAVRLRDSGIPFTMNIIGDGEAMPTVRGLVAKHRLEEQVILHGSKPPAQVRRFMEESVVFLFTSDRNEGWGAVLNEAMNSGCAVVASHAIGAVPFMLEDGKNGCIYQDGDIEDLAKKTTYLLCEESIRRDMAQKAYATVHDFWNGQVAAERLIQLIDALGKRPKAVVFEEGPCSSAPVLSDNWFRN